MKENMRNWVTKFLVVEQMASKQQGAISTVIKELQKRYPDVFNVDEHEKIALVRSWISVLHQRRRSVHQRRNNNISKGLAQGDRIILDLTMSDSEPSSESDDDVTVVVPVDRDSRSAPTISARRCDGQAPIHVTTTTPLKGDTPSFLLGRPLKSSSTPQVQAQNNPRRAETELTFKAPQPSFISEIRTARPVTGREAEVLKSNGLYQFLSGCTPSMARLHPLFVAYGCIDEEYLYAASTWPADQIYDFLKDVGEQSKENNRMTEMDIRILRTRLRGYFADVRQEGV
ncbi:hypothetical protein NLJ89_g7320 [Agrocybe chaxingu]|uniref:Uncharacterized protein n=1 Tax=Agrocybe chaxingu TaxID=84603 RepID=A0A9W8JXF1_9AGAR|nr:hypothetical protein NLJ89_g7320 [Agrocybe chaxingu]